MTPLLAAVVLAGGDGRRMGGAKPLRRFGGTTLVGQALACARSYSDDVAVAVRDPRQVAGAVDAPLILDDPAIEGPLAGLASALRFGRRRHTAWVLVLPCDSPRLPPDLAVRLRAALADGRGVAVAESGGRLHPACALWRVDAGLEALPAYLASGRRALRGFADAIGMRAVTWPSAATDPFANANTPAELDALQPHRGQPVAAI